MDTYIQVTELASNDINIAAIFRVCVWCNIIKFLFGVFKKHRF